MRLALTGTHLHAAYSPLVKDRIRIRERQLVALDMAASPPEIVWRWYIGEVESVTSDTIVVRRADLPPGSSTAIANPDGHFSTAVGSEVYYTRFADWEVAGIAANGVPADPASIEDRHLGRVAAALVKAASA